MDHILPYTVVWGCQLLGTLKANVLSGLLASKRTYIEKAEGIDVNLGMGWGDGEGMNKKTGTMRAYLGLSLGW